MKFPRLPVNWADQPKLFERYWDKAMSMLETFSGNVDVVNSYPTGCAVSADSSGVVTITSHSRNYGDQAVVSVNAGSVNTGAAAGSVVRLYYNDPKKAGGAVTYQATVDPATPIPQGNGIHSVAVVTIPSSGTASGKLLQPPGFIV